MPITAKIADFTCTCYLCCFKLFCVSSSQLGLQTQFTQHWTVWSQTELLLDQVVQFCYSIITFDKNELYPIYACNRCWSYGSVDKQHHAAHNNRHSYGYVLPQKWQKNARQRSVNALGLDLSHKHKQLYERALKPGAPIATPCRSKPPSIH